MKVFGLLKSAQLELWSSDPVSAAQTGRVGFHTTTLRPRIANGTLWKDLAFSGGTATNDNHLVLAKAGTTPLNVLTREQGSLFFDTDTATLKYDDGSALVELATANGQFSLNNGSVTAPSLKFTNDTQTGLYLVSPGNFGFTVQGTQRLLLTTAGASVNGLFTSSNYGGTIKGLPGSAAAPIFSFTNDPQTGIYGNAGGSQLNITVTNGLVARFTPGQSLFNAGVASAPGLSTLADTNTGIYFPAADQIGLSLNGTLRFTFTASNFISTQPIETTNGSVSSPGFRFTSESDTGLYRVGTDQIGFACNGAAAAMISASGIASGGATTASSIKWNVFSGTTSAAFTTFTVGTTILAAIGCYSTESSPGVFAWAAIPIASGELHFTEGTGSGVNGPKNTIRLSGNGFVYRVVIFYQ